MADMNALSLRPMTEADIPDVLAIETSANDFPWSEGNLHDCLRVHYDCCVLLRDKTLIGFVIYWVKANECHIFNICITPDEQGKGYGRTLLQKTFEAAKKNNADTVFLEVRRSNTKAIRLYHHFGFNEAYVRKNYYPTKTGREDAIVLGCQSGIFTR